MSSRTSENMYIDFDNFKFYRWQTVTREEKVKSHTWFWMFRFEDILYKTAFVTLTEYTPIINMCDKCEKKNYIRDYIIIFLFSLKNWTRHGYAYFIIFDIRLNYKLEYIYIRITKTLTLKQWMML